jgi:hypothetical protein
MDKEPYLRWEPATSANWNPSLRGDDLRQLNERTLELIHEQALRENNE